ncbi:hypothetical protein GMSM_02160 [Geomonas sp. Red276]
MDKPIADALLDFYQKILKPEFDSLRQKQVEHDQRFTEMNGHLDGIYHRLGRLEDEKVAMNARLDRIENRLDRMDSRLDRMDSRLDQVDSRLDQIEKRVSMIEIRLDHIENAVLSGASKHSGLSKDVKDLKDQIANLESRLEVLEKQLEPSAE